MRFIVGLCAVPYLQQASCCNNTPGYNDMLQEGLQQLERQRQIAFVGSRFGEADEYARLIQEAQSQFFPCRSSNSSTASQESILAVSSLLISFPRLLSVLYRLSSDDVCYRSFIFCRQIVLLKTLLLCCQQILDAELRPRTAKLTAHLLLAQI